MARRATESDEDANFRSNGISSLDRVFRGADTGPVLPPDSRSLSTERIPAFLSNATNKFPVWNPLAAPRERMKQTAFIGALRLIEDAVDLLRDVPARSWLLY